MKLRTADSAPSAAQAIQLAEARPRPASEAPRLPDLPPRTAPVVSAPARVQAPTGVMSRLAHAFGRLNAPVAAALAGASLTAAVVGAPLPAQAQQVEAPVVFELDRQTALPESLLNPEGIGNPSGSTGLFAGTRVGQAAVRSPRLDDSILDIDPNSVMTRNTSQSGAAEIRQIMQNHVGAPHTAEVIAAKLAELYGPFTAANSAENRAAIIENLRWIADGTGIRYDNARADGNAVTTQTPNETLSGRSGVCRDTHTAVQAVLASLINARYDGAKWVPGSPGGQEGNVLTIGFANPTENHAFLVYRDPGTGGWNALEYGKSYALNASNAVDAFRALPGYVAGYQRYRVTGWDSRPVVGSPGVVSAAAARAFFQDDPGVGTKGELRFSGGEDQARITAFLTDRLSLTGELAEGEPGNGLDGGIKLNYHKDFETVDSQGYLRMAGGLYTSGFETSDTGQRGLADRTAYRTYVLAFQMDQRNESKPKPLLGEHLAFKYGYDTDFLVGLPFSNDGFVPGAISAYSQMEAGADGTLLGRERIGPDLTLDWAVRARYELDLQRVATELVTSEGKDLRALGADALRTDFALALTHQAGSGLITRFEAGGTQLWGSPLDASMEPTGNHHALLTISPESGDVNFGLIARGERIDGKTIPVNSLGVALRLNPSDNVQIGLSADTVFPDGDFGKAGDNVRVFGGVNIKF